MSLLPFALESHVDEALRLFQVSTLDAALSGSLTGTYVPHFSLSREREEVCTESAPGFTFSLCRGCSCPDAPN